MSLALQVDPRYARGPLPPGVHTPEARDRIRKMLDEARESIDAVLAEQEDISLPA